MRIGLLAPPWVAVPPIGYGGTEAVVDTLARGLAAAGHEPRLFTVGTSTCPVPRRWYFDAPVSPMNTSLEEAAHVLAGYDELSGVDVIHDHTTIGPAVAGPQHPAGPPVVTTYHNPFTRDSRTVVRLNCRYSRLIAISRSHARHSGDVPVGAVIPHGIDVARHPFGGGGGGYLVWIGRMTAEKGAARAVRLARRDGRPLVLIGKMRTPEERACFTDEVRPLLRRADTVMVEPPKQVLLAVLAGADALLNPIDWEEPFGMVMIEAQACGTPVVATPRGAAPELIDPGVTGFLASTDDDLLTALRTVADLDRRACRAWVAERYSAERMVADHVAFYRRVLGRSRTADPGGAGHPADVALAAFGPRQRPAVSA